MGTRKQKYAMEPQPFGRGGNAEVFRARDKRNNEIVALKRIINKNEESIARMRREIEVQISICHPNVMPVFDQSTEYHWYTMPLAIKVLVRIPTPIDDNVILKMVKDCAAGLYRGHVDGYIHRDISPNNILFLDDRDGERWVVSDWGFVRCLGNTTKVRTLAGQEYGTAGFAAKELWIDAHAADWSQSHS
jgi:serine/threonine protein kinase